MPRILLVSALVVVVCLPLAASEVTLHQVTFPEQRSVELGFVGDTRAPRAELEAKVEHRQGQALIDLRYKGMKPAILFGGDVTCFVLWSVAGEGDAENLGEVVVANENDSLEFSTGRKSFALLVTAEMHPLVSSPSSLVMFSSTPPDSKKAPSEVLQFTQLGEAPAIEYPSIAAIMWSKDFNVDVRQAEKVLELAKAEGAEEFASSELRRAATMLAQATNLASVRKDKDARDYARRAMALGAEALQVAERQRRAAALEAEIAARQAEMAALESRAAEAEAAAEAALAEIARQQAEAEAALAAASAEREAVLASAAAEKAMLDEQVASLRGEREELSSRLAGALSKVAETQSSARGMIVNLPDILFDTNEATLKDGAKVVIAKLAGILLIMEELNLRVEGHTDSTGSADYNQGLSERRATSVRDFLAQQGVDPGRMVAVGYGLTRPVADNETKEGRAKNRRVEIVIAEGNVAAAE